MRKTKTMIAGAALAVGVAGGSLAVAAVDPLGSAGAQGTEAPADEGAPPLGEGGGRGGPLAGVLGELVEEGTITAEQADAIRAEVEERAEAWRAEHPDGPGRHGGPGRPGGIGGPGLPGGAGEEVAGALGMTVEELGDALRDGQSLAEVAEARGVERAALEQAVRDALTARVDEGVADGRLTQERADELLAELDERVADLLDRTPPEDGPRGRGAQA